MKLKVLVIAVLTLLSCPAFAGGPPKLPETINCAECGMRVKGAGLKFASQLVFRDGKVRHFCDLGDLFVYYEVLKDRKTVSESWVRDYNTGEWAEAGKSWYVTGTTVVTPMRFGILAFRTKAGADKFKKEKGGVDVMDFQGVLASRIYRR